MITHKERQVEKVGLVVDVFENEGNTSAKLGSIYRVRNGWQYQPLLGAFGEAQPTVDDVLKLLENSPLPAAPCRANCSL